MKEAIVVLLSVQTNRLFWQSSIPRVSRPIIIYSMSKRLPLGAQYGREGFRSLQL